MKPCFFQERIKKSTPNQIFKKILESFERQYERGKKKKEMVKRISVLAG